MSSSDWGRAPLGRGKPRPSLAEIEAEDIAIAEAVAMGRERFALRDLPKSANTRQHRTRQR